MRVDLPAGRVTLLFTDIEGSTRLIEQLGEAGYIEALGEHRRLLRAAFSAHGGVEVDTQGDAFLYAFADPSEAAAAAVDGQGVLERGPVLVRMGVHTGELQLTGEGYAGRELHRAARIAASGHGGQVVVSSATRALIDGDLTELGEHRLKDFDEPVALFQLGEKRFPPLKTISNTNLPRPASSFVGRERERDQLVAMLSNGTRLVTLSGPGGSGKTRLSLETATELVSEFKAGVFWVGLSTLRDPALVIDAIAETLGAKSGLAEHVGERELLLVLDNFEQVADAAPELGALLRTCPKLRAMVTSRELLRIDGEVEYPVPPLAEREAVELFCTRSGLEPDETVPELCRRLDNMPLAVELAAARTRVLTPIQILERLGQRLDLFTGGRDAEPRQQTLRATIEWSYDLLDEAERELFARLAVFAGGCTLETAEKVAYADLDVLQSLLDKSLLRLSGQRFWMLETIREYAHNRLAASGEEAELRRRHGLAFLEFVEQTNREMEELLAPGHEDLPGLPERPTQPDEPDQPAENRGDEATYLERMDAEHENTRAALEWARETNEHEVLLRLVVGARFAWSWRGRSRDELKRWLELAVERATEPAKARARALIMLADTLTVSSDRTSADPVRWTGLLAEARRLAESESDDDLFLEIMDTAAWLALSAGDLDGAREQFTTMSDHAAELNNLNAFAKATGGIATTLAFAGDFERALVYGTQSLEAFRATEDDGGVLFLLEGCGWCRLALSEPARASSDFLEAIGMAEQMGSSLRAARNVAGLGTSLAAQAREEEGTELLAAYARAAAELGISLEPFSEALSDAAMSNAKTALGEERYAAAWARGEAMSLQQAIASAQAVTHL